MDATVAKHVNNPIYAGTGVVASMRRFYLTHCCTEREAQWIGYIQSLGPPRFRRFMTKVALCCSFFGEGPAYIILLCWLVWGNQPIIGYYFSISLSMGLIMTHSLKDLMGCPRPYSPPVTKHTADVTHTTEYGLPSTHTACGAILAHTAAASFITGGVLDRTQAALIASGLVGAIGMSRVYLGMHWTGDVFVGFCIFLIWAACHVTFLPLLVDYVAFQIPITSWSMFFVPLLFGQWVLNIHAAPKEACPCFEDSARFLGANVGSMLGIWYNRVVRAPKYDLDAYIAQTPSVTQLPLAYTVLRLVLGLVIVIFAQDTFSKLCIRPLAACLRFAAGGYSHIMPETMRPIYRLCCGVFGLIVFFRIPDFNAAVVDGTSSASSSSQQQMEQQKLLVKEAATAPTSSSSKKSIVNNTGGSSISASGATLNLTVPPSPDATPANDGGENALPLRGAAAAAAASGGIAPSAMMGGPSEDSTTNRGTGSSDNNNTTAASSQCCGGHSHGGSVSATVTGTVWSLRTHNHWDQSRNSMKYLSYILLSFLATTFVNHVAFPIIDVPLVWLHTF